jgi:hypothetical protein
MDKFFRETSAEELMGKFRNLGYTFYKLAQIEIGNEVADIVECEKNATLNVATPAKYRYWHLANPQNNFTEKDAEISQRLFFCVISHYDTSATC